MIKHLNNCLENGKTPEWIMKGKTCLTLKDEKKGNETWNSRLVRCLPITWRVSTEILANPIYGYMEREDRGAAEDSRGTKDELMIDK